MKLVAVVVLAMASCGGSSKPEPAPIASSAPAEEVLGKLESLREQMCACHAGDRACARKVQQALGDFKDAHRDARVPFHEVKRIALVEHDTEQCAKHATEDDLMAVMTHFKDEMCACPAGDKDCAMRVQKEMQDFAEAHRDDMGDRKMTDDDMKKATDIGMAMAKCSAAAMGINNP